MAHPITRQRRALVIYTTIWILVTVVNGLILIYGRDLSIMISFTDALVSNILLGLLGLLVWYPTRYIPFQPQTPVYSISAHIAAGLLVMVVWLVATIGILGAIFSGNLDYKGFLTSSIFWRAILGIMIYLVLVLVYYQVMSSRRLTEQAKAEERLRTLVKESELNMLKSQINPHFLFNSLNSVSSLIMSSPEEAQEMIMRLSDFIRYSLKHRENEYVTLHEEIVRMKDYLAIEKVRFGDKLLYTLNMDGNCENVEVPTMILQPLIENAIKHGVYESLEPVEIDFKCAVDNGFLNIQITNDFDPSSPSRRGTGVGLENVSERIRLAYDSRGTLNWKVAERKFIVKLSIPLLNTLKDEKNISNNN